ncbi:MAG: hypothetical protein P1U88_08885, partial [Thalassobaculaceae bacterium]|nr:hypothetical protein [Thalassobaculaceae bacterium]
MSRDTTAWSVKGIDQATRDIARRAAASSGMTIGEWIDHAIKSDSANRGVPVPLDPGDRGGGPGAAPRRRVDGISADTVEAIFSRISDGERLFEARLRPIGYALKDVAERVVALERGAEQLPPPGRQGIDVEPRQPEPPVRTPIPFRPIAQAPTQQSSDREPEDDIWSSDPPTPASEPRGDRPTPTPITFRPIASPEPELADKKEDFGPVSQSEDPQPTAPNGPPEAWKPEIDIDRAALSRAAADIGTTPEEPGYPEPVGPGMEPVQAADEAEIADAEPDEIPPAPAQRLDGARRPEIDDDPTTLRERPEAIPPTADFPADPIDTRSLGLSGEPIPTALPPRRLAGAGRLAIAASVVLALVAGAAWTIHREGVVSLGAIGDRLTQAENAVHIALVETTDWVVHLVATTEHAREDTESPHGDPGTTAPSGTLASADPT